jgi:hypothetical protein
LGQELPDIISDLGRAQETRMRLKLRSALRCVSRRSAACALVLLLAHGTADAARFPDLYRVTVPPDPAAPDARAAAEKAAFARLLVRITGNRAAGTDPQLAALIENARAYENSYGLDRQGRAQVGFSASRVDQALTQLNFPVWGAERPLTLVWIAVDDGAGGRGLLGANDLPADLTPATLALLQTIRTDLATAADERGLPLALPLLDLEDLGAVTFTDVWGGFEDRVGLASARYRADAVLIGRVRPGLIGQEVDWLLLKDGQRQGIAGIALRDGIDAVADLYAQELSFVGGASLARITVLDVATSADYGRVLSYLETLSVLQNVDVESLDRGVLSLKVAARGDARVIERVLALGGVLSPDAPLGAASSGAAPLVFRLARAGSPR